MNVSTDSQNSRWSGIAAVFAIILVSVLAGIVFVKTHQKDLLANEVRFDVPIPNATFGSFCVSPDGRYIVYTTSTNGKDALWVREINSLNARLLPGTEDARIPDWSSEADTIVFAGAHDLLTIDVTGHNRKSIAPLVGFEYQRSTTNRDGVTIFANSVLRRVDATGGPPRAITQLDKSLGETFHATPWFLPDGRHFLYQVASTNPENRAVYVGSLDSTMKKRLMSSESKAVYMPPGFLLSLNGPVLMARPFDADRLEFTGDPVLVADDIAFQESGPAAFYASRAGALIYQTKAGRDPALARLMVVLNWTNAIERKQER
jgi:eukaryotic-like serine/threonine-protein kinase